MIKLHIIIKEVHTTSNGSAGARNISDMFATQGIPLSRYRASKQMKALHLISYQSPRHRYRKTNQEHITILDRQFAVTPPNQVWVIDVTYVWAGHH